MRPTAIATAAFAVACGYEAPLDGAPVDNVVSGQLLFDDGDPADAVVLAFLASNPGPPAGTGSPVALDTVAGASFGGEPGGVRAGDFFLTRLADGDYVLSGLMDTDHNFDPFVTALAGSTCGDWAGPLTEDLGAPAADVVSVAGGEWRDGVTIVLGTQLPQQRPVFELGDDELVLDDVLSGRAPPILALRATAAAGDFAPGLALDLGPACDPAPGCGGDPLCACADPAGVGCDTALWLLAKDVDLNGEPDPHPTVPGRLDVWPRVYVEYVGPGLGSFEVDGQTRPERWVAEAFPLGAELAAATEGSTPAAAWSAVTGAPPGLPLPTARLSITVPPVFTHVHGGGQGGVSPSGPYDVVLPTAGDRAGVPAGDWSVTVVSFTGQTWKLPNELAGLGDPAQGAVLHLR